MSEDDLSTFDKDFFNIRSKVASENMEWFKLFRQRNTFLTLMILSAVLVNTILIIYEIFQTSFIPIVFFIIPNITWAIFCLPYFYFKIQKLNKIIEIKREEAVVTFFPKKKSIKDIALSTGIRMDYVEYYLKKNNLSFEKTQKL